MDRTILHCDLNAFYASVECMLNPSLAGLPVAVAGNPKNRHGIILAKNEIAKKYKITTAETIWQAKQKCPELVIVPPHHDEYAKYSVNNIYEEFTDLIEPFGIDESWLDVTGVEHLFGDGKEIANKIRATVKQRLELTISVGVSFNKAFAKLGSDYKKPDATTVITRENYKEIVFPLPASDLLYVGKAAKTALSKLYINTIGELAVSDKALIKAKLGKMGEMIWEYANGLDDSPVRSIYDKQDAKSIGHAMTFKRDLTGFADIRLGVDYLADEVAYRIRKKGVKCYTVSVSIKDNGFKSISRQKTLDTPTHLSKEISQTALELILAAWDLKVPIRTITVTGSNFVDESYQNEQLSFFETSNTEVKEKQETLEATMDKIRDKYGKQSITKAGNIKNNLGIGNHNNED
ncbi:MAG: DNA polymerase IV [Oscillospiraceae bacterium]